MGKKVYFVRSRWFTLLFIAAALLCIMAVARLPGVAQPPFPKQRYGGGGAPNTLPAYQALAMEQAERNAFWRNARRIVHKDVLELVAQHQTELNRGLQFSKLMRGDTRKKEIALTFDDGPHPAYTPRILAILKKYKVPATFFLVGEMAEKYPELVRAEIEAGHSVGNHTYHHVSLPKIPAEFVATEIKSCGEVLKNITGRAPRLFRPPGGEYDVDSAQTSEALGYIMVLWTDDPGDYASPGEQIILSRTLNKATNGGIILIHDGIEQTIRMLPQIILNLQTRGYRFVTVDQMLAARRSRPAADESVAAAGKNKP